MPYDPRSSRPTPKSVPDEESAPIDALLGPSHDGVGDHPVDDDRVRLAETAASNGAGPGASPTPLPVPVRKAERAPSPVLQLAPLLLVAVVVVLWLIRRSRR